MGKGKKSHFKPSSLSVGVYTQDECDSGGYASFSITETLSRSLLKFSGGHSSFKRLPDRTLRV